MTIKRKLASINTPALQPGFLGAGHMARPVVGGSFSTTDPFIFLMDDILDKKDDEPAGGAHPHAGFETVSLLLEGEIGDEAHTMKSGDFQVMTAGSGVVHSEIIEKKTRMRLLQLWINLPKENRWATPRVQDLPDARVPVRKKDGITIKLYSGSLGELNSPVLNYSPFIAADISMEPGITTVETIPTNFNAFLYVLSGSVFVGEERRQLNKDQVGWLDLFDNASASGLILATGDSAARFVLYAGKPTGDTIISHGPFIGGNPEDIARLYQEYRQGKMQHIATVPKSQRILW